MEPTEDFRIAQHNSLQGLAYHFDSINWNMHTIFVPLHVALAAWLAISLMPPSGSLWKDPLGALIGFAASIVGLWLTRAWRKMFERHRLFITTAYKRLRAIETSLVNSDEDVDSFKVHTLMGPAIDERRGSGTGDVPTNAVVFGIQGWLKVVYFLTGVVALGRALYLSPSAFEQLRSWLSATVC